MKLSIGFMVAFWTAAVVVCGACTSTADLSGDTNVECRALTATETVRPTGWTGSVFTIVMENHDRAQIIGNPNAPYINSLATEHAVATGYHTNFVHPSMPNYIWMVAGQNFGILSNDDPYFGNAITSRSHLANQIERAGYSWKTYQESMGAPCGLQSHGSYGVKHNPFAYFADINGWDGRQFQPSPRCIEHMVDYSEFDTDLAAGEVPDYVFITPNLDHDMHDGTIAEGDAWLSGEVPKILASDRYLDGGVLFLLWDEGSGQGDDPPFIAISPNARAGVASETGYDTTSFLKTVQAILGVEALPCSPEPDAVPVMDDLFAVSLDR